MAAENQPLRLALVGCGAISELYYGPALQEACKHTALEVVAFCDPTAARLDALLKFFPGAKGVATLDKLGAFKPDLAVVASPPKFHAAQTNALLADGVHVLCEKPMASSVAEAESMNAAAKAAKRVLAIGLFRRFFPALQMIQSVIVGGSLGKPLSFRFAEGGVFNWPAASPSFFQKQHSKGGVFLDLGVHVLDLVCWWFGEPASFTYEDDAMGNLEANSRLAMTFADGLTGEVRMSRDTPMNNRFVIEFERGRVIWKVGDSNHLDIRLHSAPFGLGSELRENGSPAATYHQSFVKQLLNFAAAARGTEPALVPGEEGIRSLRLIEASYAQKRLMPMPWLTENETQAAHQYALA